LEERGIGAAQRQFFENFFHPVRGDLGRLEVDDGRNGHDRDLFGQLPDGRHRDVDLGLPVDGDDDFGREVKHLGMGHEERVLARRQARKDETAVRAGGELAALAQESTGDLDGRVLQDAAVVRLTTPPMEPRSWAARSVRPARRTTAKKAIRMGFFKFFLLSHIGRVTGAPGFFPGASALFISSRDPNQPGDRASA
jgi:hypothetical protein